MSFSKLLPLCLALALAAPFAALADPWRDESGRDRRERGWDRRDDRRGERRDDRDRWGRGERREDRRGHYAPPPGEYRPWLPGLPPGQQPPPHRW